MTAIGITAQAQHHAAMRTAAAQAHITRLGRAGVVPPLVASLLCERLGEAHDVPALHNGRIHIRLVTEILNWKTT